MLEFFQAKKLVRAFFRFCGPSVGLLGRLASPLLGLYIGPFLNRLGPSLGLGLLFDPSSGLGPLFFGGRLGGLF